MKRVITHLNSSIGRKQVVATTGLLLILFLIAHLAGNLLLFLGPKAYNGYAHFLEGLRPGLTVAEVVLGLIFLIHIFVTYTLVLENIVARGTNYRITPSKGDRSLAAQLMPFTGTIIFTFIVFHLWDFTFRGADDTRNFINGIDYGLYGVVYNAFMDPLHSTFYIIAMICVGFHLCHAVESFCQTYGINQTKYHVAIRSFSNAFGVLVGWAFSMIPIYILIKNMVHN